MATRVVIVRHGQSTYNSQKIIQGRCDESVLTEKGRADAKTVGNALSSLQFDAIYSSPLQRAKQTAEIIHDCLNNPPQIQAVDKLLEVDLPQWEKMKKDVVQEQFPDDYTLWKTRPHKFRMKVSTPDGEMEHFPVLSLYQQAENFWREILPKHSGKTILIVAHNGINRCLISSAVGIFPERYHTLQQSNCCINVLNFAGGFGEAVQIESFNQTAHLGQKLPSPRPSHQGPRLLLVRHGETDWNKASRFQGQIDIPLNETGKAQAAKAAEFLQDVQIDFAVSSPMKRPAETAEAILESHPEVFLELQHDLREIAHGLWEGKLESEIALEYAELLQQWKVTPEMVQMPDGENLQQVWDRSIDCWNDIVKAAAESPTPQTGIIVAHDAINKVILCYLLGLSPANIWNIKQGNCAVSVIDYPNGVDELPVIQAINITTHLGGGVLDQTAAGAL
ncbi:MAG: histidine phosphatase family protein [Halothece sp.]